MTQAQQHFPDLAAAAAAPVVIDVRQIPPPLRHPTIFRHFETLPAGASFELLADHEPLPLKAQFQALWPAQFDWLPLEAGPQQWRIRVARLAAAKSCCGCCSGGA